MGRNTIRMAVGFGLVAGAAFAVGCSSDSEDTPSPTSMGNAGSGMGMETNQQDNMVAGEAEVDASDRTVRPSAACAGGGSTSQGPKTLALSSGATGEYIVTRPSDYDGTQPIPLMFAFHGANLSPTDCLSGGNCGGVRTAVEPEALTIYMGSLSGSWTDASFVDSNVAYFDELLQFAKDNYCFDERRVVALGTSSGAHFSNTLACRRGNDLMAIVPGAGEAFETDDNSQCEGRVAALVIHGVVDPYVAFDRGEAARDYYAERNGCTLPPPNLETVHSDVTGAYAAEEDLTSCVTFEGCDDGLPVRWCEHSEPGYDPINAATHGWPSTGGNLAVEFMKELY